MSQAIIHILMPACFLPSCLRQLLAFSVLVLLPAIYYRQMSVTLKSVDFEVFGRVQGVFFRKYTHDEAKKLELFGWVKNTREGTVVGVAQGPDSKIDAMKHWLQAVGSPQSRIDRCVFNNERVIDKVEFTSFSVLREPGED